MEKHLQLTETADPLLLASQNVSESRELILEGWLEPTQTRAQ